MSNLPLTGEPYPFQLEGIKFLNRNRGRAILADEMGLGKTIQSIGFAAMNPQLRPVVVVCPASLKLNWQREIERWLPVQQRIRILNGTTSSITDTPDADWIICNYDILYAWIDKLQPKLVIVDEAHMIKNPKSRRSKMVKRLADKTQAAILATGTPLVNNPIELWPLLNVVDPSRWSNYWWYARRYADAKKKSVRTRGGGYRQVWDLSGASNIPELHARLQPYMIRRTKDEVLTQLPEKSRVAVPIGINLIHYWQHYRETREELLKEDNPALAAVLIEKLKQFVVAEKLPTAIDWIETFIEQEKLIVFCTHTNTAKTLLHKFPSAAMIIGETPQSKRDAEVQRFQNDASCRLFIGNIQAAGVGLTLTAASNVMFLELGWTPGEMIQAEDRAHRIGQQYPVTIYYLLAERTIEEWIFEKLDSKRKVISQVLTGQITDANTFSKNDMARQLMEHIRRHQ